MSAIVGLLHLDWRCKRQGLPLSPTKGYSLYSSLPGLLGELISLQSLQSLFWALRMALDLWVFPSLSGPGHGVNLPG